MILQKEVKSVLNKHKKRDSWFLDDYSVNPYEGCSCNCQYCYIRGSKYGENMENGLAVKINGAAILEKQLSARAAKGEHGIVVVGSATDAYIHHEERWRITRGMLEALLKHRFPVLISTKSILIKRDMELLKEIDNAAILPADLQGKLKRGLIIAISFSTLDEKISNALEPGAASPMARLQLAKDLKQAGFMVGMHAMPLLPFISDTHERIEEIIRAARDYGFDYMLGAGLTLFGNGASDSKTLFYQFLKRYDPALIEQFDRFFVQSYYPSFSYQEQLKQKIKSLCEKYQVRNNILAD